MNLFDFPKERLLQEQCLEVLAHKNVRIEKIISQNHTTDWYDQAEDEWVVLLKGSAAIEYGDNMIMLNEGESAFIPRHKEHRAVSIGDCIWLCVFIA